MADVNTRPHRVTRRPPVVMLAEEHEQLHRLPRLPHTVCFGETRKVNWQSTISVGGAIYSVPHELIDERVWVRTTASELIVVHVDGPQGRGRSRAPVDHAGASGINDEHYPPRPAGALERKPRARCDRGAGVPGDRRGRRAVADRAPPPGAQRVRRKMAEAVDLAKLHGTDQVERALGTCASAGRFADGDLASPCPPAAGDLILFPAAEDTRCSARPALGGIRAMNTPNPPDRETDTSEPVCALQAFPRPIAARRDPTGRSGVAMTVKPPAPPPLPDELDRLLRRLRLPYVRRAAPEVIATATAQRWEHAEVLRVLLAEEAAGRDQATIRRGAARPGCRPARRSTPGSQNARRSRPDPASAAHAGMDRPRRSARDLRAERDRQEPLHRGARPSRDRQRQDRRLAHARDARATLPPPPRRRQRQQSHRQS